jgi:hypothetical protein
MKCPVCENAAAEDVTPHTFDGKTFRCPTCGEYDIVGSVYDPGTLEALDLSKRKDALARAKRQATGGRRPRITTYDL